MKHRLIIPKVASAVNVGLFIVVDEYKALMDSTAHAQNHWISTVSVTVCVTPAFPCAAFSLALASSKLLD